MNPQPKLTRQQMISNLSYFINHWVVETICMVIGIYGIALGIIATMTTGFFTLSQYSFHSLLYFLTPDQIERYYLWYEAYPYSLLIFGSFILALLYKFNKDKKGHLALPIWMVTYALWDFTGIGTNILKGYSIIWLAIFGLSMIYYFPLRKLFSYNVSIYYLALYFGIGVMFLQNLIIPFIPPLPELTKSIISYINGIGNELTWCILCYTTVTLKKKDSL